MYLLFALSTLGIISGLVGMYLVVSHIRREFERDFKTHRPFEGELTSRLP